MAKIAPLGIYSGLLDALMKGGAARLEEFEIASNEPHAAEGPGNDLILRDRELAAESADQPAPPFEKVEKETKSTRE